MEKYREDLHVLCAANEVELREESEGVIKRLLAILPDGYKIGRVWTKDNATNYREMIKDLEDYFKHGTQWKR